MDSACVSLSLPSFCTHQLQMLLLITVGCSFALPFAGFVRGLLLIDRSIDFVCHGDVDWVRSVTMEIRIRRRRDRFGCGGGVLGFASWSFLCSP